MLEVPFVPFVTKKGATVMDYPIVRRSVCFFCSMPGASTVLGDSETELHQYQCHTTQCLHAVTGKIISTQRSPACLKIEALLRKVDELEEELRNWQES